MTTQITSGASTISPAAVLGYEANRETQTIVHPILGNTSPDVSLRPAMMRNGTLQLAFTGSSSETDSKTAADLLSSAATFALVSTDLTSVPMNFVVQGTVTRSLEDETRAAWTVSFDFQETT